MKGKTRNQVYSECLHEMRVATAEELNLMMLRNSRMVSVKRDGVLLKLYNTELTFWSSELVMDHIGEKVYFRWNPDDLSEVRIYDEQDRFLCTAQQQTALGYFADKEAVAEKMREQRTLERAVSAYKKQKDIQATDALKLVMQQAERNLADGEHLNPKIVVPIRHLEDTAEQHRYLQNAVGAEEPIDWTEAIQRLEGKK